MPPYQKEELVVIGQDMVKCPDFPRELLPTYSENHIRDRFDRYHGVIPHVLPIRSRDISELEAEIYYSIRPEYEVSIPVQKRINMNGSAKSAAVNVLTVPQLETGKYVGCKFLRTK